MTCYHTQSFHTVQSNSFIKMYYRHFLFSEGFALCNFYSCNLLLTAVQISLL